MLKNFKMKKKINKNIFYLKLYIIKAKVRQDKIIPEPITGF